MSNKLKEELKKIASDWNASGEYDETDFEGQYFIGDAELDEFAEKHRLGGYDDQGIFVSDYRLIEEKCKCRLNSFMKARLFLMNKTVNKTVNKMSKEVRELVIAGQPTEKERQWTVIEKVTVCLLGGKYIDVREIEAAEKVTAYRLSDGKLVKSKKEAVKAQYRLDFEEWIRGLSFFELRYIVTSLLMKARQ